MRFCIYLLMGIVMIPLVSCEKEEKIYVETETHFAFDIPMSTEAVNLEKSEKLTEQEISFSGESYYQGARINNVENRLYRVEDVRPHKEPHLIIQGVAESNDIQTLHLEWGYKSTADENYSVQESIDLLNFEHMIEDGNFKVNLDDALVQIISTLDNNPDNSIWVHLTGTSGFNFDSTAKLEIPVMVKSSVISLRYELF